MSAIWCAGFFSFCFLILAWVWFFFFSFFSRVSPFLFSEGWPARTNVLSALGIAAESIGVASIFGHLDVCNVRIRVMAVEELRSLQLALPAFSLCIQSAVPCQWQHQYVHGDAKTKENRGRYPSHGSRAYWRRLYRWVAHGNCCPSPALTRSRRGSERLASERLARRGPSLASGLRSRRAERLACIGAPSASLASGLRAPRPIPPALGTLPACSRHVAAWVVARTRVWGRASQTLARCRFPWGLGQEAGIALLAVRCCKNSAGRACTDERTDGQTDKTRAGLHRVQMWGAGWGYSCR